MEEARSATKNGTLVSRYLESLCSLDLSHICITFDEKEGLENFSVGHLSR